MNNWTVDYWHNQKNKDSIEKWFNTLTIEQFQSVAKELKLLEFCGNALRLPHSKSLKKGLFELRERKYGYRIYYAFIGKRAIILLAAGDKKSQQSDIKVARQRLEQVEVNNN